MNAKQQPESTFKYYLIESDYTYTRDQSASDQNSQIEEAFKKQGGEKDLLLNQSRKEEGAVSRMNQT